MDLDLLAVSTEAMESAVFNTVIDVLNTTDADETTAKDVSDGPEVWGYDAVAEALEIEIGSNASNVAAAGPRDTISFVNRMKTATGWTAYGDTSQFETDDHGYVTSVPDNSYAASNILRYTPELDGNGPYFGEYRLYGTGAGVIALMDMFGYAVSPVNTANLETEVVDGVEYWFVDFTYKSDIDGRGREPMVNMLIYRTDDTDYIQDLALVHETHLDAFHANETFTPEFLEDVKDNDTIRYMDWMLTNHLNEEYENGPFTDPEDRYLTLDNYTYATRGGGWNNLSHQIFSMPIETIVELSNLLDADAWINLPVDVTDGRALEIAKYVSENLEPELSVYWEYGNELWNSAAGFDSYTYAVEMAIDTFGLDESVPGLTAAAEWAGYRGPQVYDLIETCFENNPAIDVRYVGAVWAADKPVNANGTFKTSSYSYIYFDAVEAQKMEDAPSLPEDIITDYAIGLYFGDPGDGPQTMWVLETYDTVEEQAEAMARWLLFGANEETYHDLDTSALAHPETDVEWRDDLNISVFKIVGKDIAAGLDNLRDLNTVLRLEGNALQYKGVRASDWTTIMTFDREPSKSLEEMIEGTNLIGYGNTRYGVAHSGLGASVARTADLRLDGHQDFAEALGLNFVSYEGGMSLSEAGKKKDGVAELYNELIDSGWTAVITKAMLEKADDAGMTLFNKYTTHDTEAFADHWGTKAYVGQSLDEAPLASYLHDLAQLELPAGAAASAESGTLEDWRTARLLAPLTIDTDYDWTDLGDGSYQTDIGHEELTVNMGVVAGKTYMLSFDLGGDQDLAGDLNVYVQGYGNGSTTILSDRQTIVNGAYSEFQLEIPEPHNQVRIVIKRVGAVDGMLKLSNISLGELVDTAPEAAPDTMEGTAQEEYLDNDTRMFALSEWTVGETWTLDPVLGIATASAVTGSKLETTFGILRDKDYSLSFDVAATGGGEAGSLRVKVQAAGGGGSVYVAEYDEVVSDGQHVSISLDAIPEPHTYLRVIVSRGPGMVGELTLSDLSLNMHDDASGTLDTPAFAELHEEGPLIEQLNVATQSFDPSEWNVKTGWLLDPLQGAAISTGVGAINTAINSIGGTAYILSFDVESDLAAGIEAGDIKVWVEARGGDTPVKLANVTRSINDNEHVSIRLNITPEDSTYLRVVISRSGAAENSLTLTNLSLSAGTSVPAALSPFAAFLQADSFAIA